MATTVFLFFLIAVLIIVVIYLNVKIEFLFDKVVRLEARLDLLTVDSNNQQFNRSKP